jgi:hypothetical protein
MDKMRDKAIDDVHAKMDDDLANAINRNTEVFLFALTPPEIATGTIAAMIGLLAGMVAEMAVMSSGGEADDEIVDAAVRSVRHITEERLRTLRVAGEKASLSRARRK